MTAPGQTRLRQIVVEAIFRRRAIFATTVLLVLAIVAAVILFLPRQYKAEAKLMVQNVRAATPLSATAPIHQTTQEDVSQSEINSEVDLLQSPMVARRAIGVPTSGVTSRQAQQDMVELKRRLTVDAVHQTNLIDLGYRGDSPANANRGLQKVIDAYFEARASNARASGTAEFFDRQLEDAKKALDEGQKALTGYGLTHEIADLDDEKKLQLARVSALQDQIAQVDATLAQQRSRQAHQNAQLISTPARSRTVERVITNQYSQERLNTALVDLQNRRAELVRRYSPNDRQILELDDKIANTKLAISDAAAKPATEMASDVNPLWQQLSTSVAVTAAEVSGLQAQRGILQRQFELAQGRLNDLEKSTADVNALKRNLAQAQQDYTLYSQRRADAGISAELDKEKLFDVSLVQPPYSTTEPTRPRPLLYGVTGLVFALLLGTLLAVYADTSSGHVYTPAQLDALTGSRTLATLADTGQSAAAEEMNALEYRRLLFSIHKSVQERQNDPTNNFLSSPLKAAHGEFPRGAMPEAYCVALTSASRDEGVSYVARHLAEEASRQFGSQVAVLNVREMLRRFDSEGERSFGFALHTSDGYWVLADGGDAGVVTRDLGSLGSFALRLCPWLLRARQEMDLILLDCPSNIESTLAGEVEPCIDGYVAIVSAGRAGKNAVDQLGVALSERRAPLLGYVLNRRSYPIPRWLHRLVG